MKQKLLSGLLICLMAGSLAACGTKGKTDTSQDETVNGTGEESPDAAEPENSSGISAETGINPVSTENEVQMSSDEELYMQFLNDETQAIVEPDFVSALNYVGVAYDFDPDYTVSYIFNSGESLSYSQLKSAVGETPDLDLSGEERYYAISDTVSGKKILAVKFQNMNIYSPGDDSYAVFLFAVNNGRLYMTYAFDSWDRNYVEVGEHMIFAGQGSAGAGDSVDWCGYIDETGHYKLIYRRETLYDDWVAMYDWEDFGMDTEWSRGCTFQLLATLDGSYYSFEAESTVDPEKLAIFIDHLKTAGMSEIDNVENAIDAAFEANGISMDQISAFDGWEQWD